MDTLTATKLDCQSGFGNEFATEALPGALPDAAPLLLLLSPPFRRSLQANNLDDPAKDQVRKAWAPRDASKLSL